MKKRFAALLLSFLLAVTLVPIHASASFSADWSTWSQGGSDLTYRSTLNNGSYAFRTYGCHFIAHAKLMAEAGIIDPASFNPDAYNDWVLKNGYIYGRQKNGTYAVGERAIGASLIHYAASKGVKIRSAGTVSLSRRSAQDKKNLIQSYLKQGYYIILDCPAHEAYVMRSKSLQAGTPWISDSSRNYPAVSTRSGIYAYTGTYLGGGKWEADFNTAYLYALDGSSAVPPVPAVSGYPVTQAADTITETSAILRGSFTTQGAKATECGMYLGTASNSMTKLGSDAVNSYGVDMWYSTQKYGRTLKPGTKYYYQSYCVAGGKVFKGEVKEFTTAGSSIQASLSLDQHTMSLPGIGIKDWLTATRQPVSSPVTWSSSNPSVAAVDNAGCVTGVSAGTATITAAMEYNGTSYRDSCTVTVTVAEAMPLTAPVLSVSASEMTQGSSFRANWTQAAADAEYVLCFSGETMDGDSIVFGQVDCITALSAQVGSDWKAGTYSFWIRAKNPSGMAESNRVTIAVRPVYTEPTQTGVVVNTDGQYLAINDAPAASPKYSNQIGRIPPGGSVIVYPNRTSGNWYYVTYNGVSGYVYNKFLAVY